MTSSGKKARPRGVLRRHSLGLTVLALLLTWLLLYIASDPSTHLGSFYGNAVADWLGTLIIVVATKYLYEIGSPESRQPHPRSRGAAMRFVIDHSLTIGLVVTGLLWAVFYSRLEVNGKTGQVVGNIVSEWTQIIGIVVITKYTREIGSKESKG
jgi:membrane protease YdiL (CAAX protease family)